MSDRSQSIIDFAISLAEQGIHLTPVCPLRESQMGALFHSKAQTLELWARQDTVPWSVDVVVCHQRLNLPLDPNDPVNDVFAVVRSVARFVREFSLEIVRPQGKFHILHFVEGPHLKGRYHLPDTLTGVKD